MKKAYDGSEIFLRNIDCLLSHYAALYPGNMTLLLAEMRLLCSIYEKLDFGMKFLSIEFFVAEFIIIFETSRPT
jgi:hypothetical protein